MTSIALRFLLTVAVLFITIPASAITIRVEVTGSVSFVPSFFASEFPLGTPMSGFFEFNPPGTDIFPTLPTTGTYNDALTAFSLTIGTYTATSTGAEIEVFDNALGDAIQVNADPASGLIGDVLLGSFNLTRGHFVFNDLDGSTLSSDALPTPAEIMAFPLGSFTLAFDSGGLGGQVSGNLTSVVAFVPEPSSFVLLLGAWPIILRRKTRKVTTHTNLTDNRG